MYIYFQILDLINSLSDEEKNQLLVEIEKLSNQPVLYYNQLRKSNFSSHFTNISDIINSTIPKQVLFHSLNPNIIFCECGNKVKWNKLSYRKFCSNKCATISEDTKTKIKSKMLEKYGVEYPSQSAELRNKRKVNFVEKYGVENPFQLDEIKKQIKQTNLEKYGVDNPFKSDIIKHKVKQVNLEKYGVEHATQNLTIKNKIKQTNLEKFGVEHYFQTAELKEKSKITMVEKYGVEHAAQSTIVQEKMKKTNLERFGVENFAQTTEYREKYGNTCIERYGVEFPSLNEKIKDKSAETRNKNKENDPHFNEKINAKRKQTSLEKIGREHHFQKHYSLDTLEFLKNDELFTELVSKTTMKELAETFGISTYPIYAKMKLLGLTPCFEYCNSSFQKQVLAYIQSIYNGPVIINDRTAISPKEIDIYIPELKLGVECNGIYWHSELNGKNKKYHVSKTNNCLEKNITLFHICDFHWYNSQEIVKSMLQHKLGLSTKIHARKCEIKQISSKESTIFFDLNHIQGNSTSKIIFGLYYDNELVSCMSFGKPRFNRKYEWEIIRFANKLNFSVVGGASKLFSHFIKNYTPNSIISYSDRMIGLGSLYSKLGFNFDRITEPAYYYTKNYLTYESRVKYQKHKLEKLGLIFDPNLTEWENMQNNGYDRIYDSGNDVYIWNSNNEIN